MSEEGKDSHHHHHGHHHHHHHHEDDQPPPPPPPPAEYGTFQAPPQPVVGFPQPVPPPGAFEPSPEYYARAYQVVPGYVVDERGPVREPRLPCCGIGLGWFLFITGFFLVAIPWYVAAFILLCTRSVDHREKPGYVTCTIAQAYKVMVYNITLQVIIETAVLATIAIVFGLTRI
ncbi:large ribosomal subunit protein eL20z isoform X2 [Nicotiana tabacum]|uniref:Large ribosomal subunit protein eL20z isoform X2 n=2 Tax=Nicotiana tabacum TaxID=4097 RepID=A0AC58T4P2_TOBAC|nr:PREDICTED: 60S ribosomal protein L18a-like protein [Nicotiana tabacum]